jgi:hypothetical protein
MKYVSITLLSLLCVAWQLTVSAQDIELSASLIGISYPLTNNSSTNSPVPFSSGLGTFSFTITNAATSGNLTLTPSGGKYLQLSGSGVNDFNINESNITGTLAPGESVTVSVSLKTTVGAGNRTITVNINSNDPDENPFTATLGYNVIVPNLLVTVSGLTLSNGGSTNYPTTITSNNMNIVITISNTGSGPLLLTQQNCPTTCTYFALSGSGASDFSLSETGVSNPLPANNSYQLTVSPSNVVSNGSRSVTVTMLTNDPNQNIYTHTINYTVNFPALSVLSATSAGIKVYPSPSLDGTLYIDPSIFTIQKIEMIDVLGKIETFNQTIINSEMKGIITVLIYTDKGIFREKVWLQ